ncbi:MAG TPA: ATP-binding protein [Limnobacter sp.]|nr:ATP-binding protein [Limnobacter sp.]
MSTPKPYSLRRRILVSLSAALMVSMGVAGWASYRVALHEADEIFSARLATSARVLESLLARQVEHATINAPLEISLPAELSETDPDDPSPLGHPYETKLAFQVWSDDGRLLVRSRYAPDDRLGPLEEGFWERESDGMQWHVFTLRSNTVWIEVAEEVGLRREIASDVGLTLITPLLLGFGALILIANLIVIVGLRPLSQMAEKISEYKPEDTRDIDLHNPPEELLPVQHALNALLARVRDALQRERRFTDAAAHELRTPLTALRLHAENAANADNEEDRAISQAYLLQGLDRTRRLVEQMLTYSRVSAGGGLQGHKSIHLNAELVYLVNNQKQLLEGTGQTIQLHLPKDPITVHGQAELLEVMLRNLLDNACKHANRRDTPIELTLEQHNDTPRIIITNPSPRIEEQDLKRIFEPYHRGTQAQGTGHGLGLAIVAEVALRHGWQVFATWHEDTQKLAFHCIFVHSATITE